MAEQWTGKHGHKDTHESYPHHGAKEGNNQQQGNNGQADRKEQGSPSESKRHSSQEDGAHQRHGSGSEESLKEREYRGADGEVHHHTKTYMEQHEGKE